MEQERFRKLVSGEEDILFASLLRFLLCTTGLFYGFIMRIRNTLYDKGILKISSAAKPVISIGNITVGGTGKTPLVIRLCRMFQQSGHKVGILTRGYKSSRIAKGDITVWIDEPGILAEGCEGAGIIVNSDRVAGAKEAVAKFGADILIMDDGFQHRRLAREVDIVTIDATEPFGYGRLIPGGLLREPISSLRRADAVIVNRCEQVEEERLGQIEEVVLQVKPNMIIARSVYEGTGLKLKDGSELKVKALEGKKLFAFCGIGNPSAFERTLADAGAKISGFRIFNDHHLYDDDDVSEIVQAGVQSRAEMIVTTKKDWLKIAGFIEDSEVNWGGRDEIPMGYLEIRAELVAGEKEIRELIEERTSVTISCQ